MLKHYLHLTLSVHNGSFSPWSISLLFLLPKQRVHTEGFLRRCKGRCLIRVLQMVCGILSVNPSAFRLRRLAQSVVPGAVPGLGLRHFTCKFSHKVLIVQCPSAFGLRRLAQSVVTGLGLRHFTCKFSCEMGETANQVHFDFAGSHKLWSPVLVCGVLLVNSRAKLFLSGQGILTSQARVGGILLVNSCTKWLLRHVHVHFACAGSHKVWGIGPPPQHHLPQHRHFPPHQHHHSRHHHLPPP